MPGRLRFVLPLVLGTVAPALSLALSSSSCSLAGLSSGGAGPTSSSASTGGAASTSGTAGSSATAGGGTGGAAPMTCPTEMVQVDVPQDDGSMISFCIDKLEVTNADYLEFLAKGPVPKTSDALCGWNTTFEPAVHPDASEAHVPVLGVDWCDARDYCKSRHKRLCGNLFGGEQPEGHLDLKDDQWFAACSNNNAAAYPYGTTDASFAACRDCDPDAGCDASAPIGPDAAAIVGSIGTCEGGVPGLFDMSGNAWEWQDSCSDDGLDAGERAPEYDHCYRRGGGYDVPHVVDGGGNYSDKCLACAACSSGKSQRHIHPTDTGIRCCLDLSP